MDALASPGLRIAVAAVATAVATGSLTHLARRGGPGRWATLSALLLGPDERAGVDLRFAGVVAALATGLAWVVACDSRLRELSPTARVAAIAVALPLAALLEAGLADLLAQRAPDCVAPEPELAPSATATPVRMDDTAAVPRPAPSDASRDEANALIDEALSEVVAARSRTSDGGVREALAAMEETLAGYARALREPDADLERISVRVREVLGLARDCEDDGSEAFRTLGLKRDASVEDARRVYRDLARIYHADAGASGVDPDKFKEISVAYDRVRELVSST